MFRKLVFINILTLLSVSSVYAQDDNESKGFYRIGIGIVNFEHSSYITNPEYVGYPHYHEAGLTANLSLGYGTDKFRALVFFDPTIVDGVQGTSIVSVGTKGELGVPKLGWLKLGGGVMYSHNHAKLSDDIKLYERGGLDTVWSPFVSVTFLPRAEGTARFFSDIRIGRAIGGDVIQPQTSKPVTDYYVSISLGTRLRFRDK